ncbi:alanine racemase [Humitalea sp. 24SJ18S-53]|uniref:alanine racemase n=1 Tax=Humitalea sp. 24SJ18S-53 TaxID=3422307 RepID=UPI003D671C7A
MTLDDLPTPCLVLDLGILRQNLAHMAAAVARHPGVVLRPHLKTAKCVEVARLAAPDGGPVTVSTLAEAEAFWAAGYHDQIYAVGITPQKLDRVAALPGVNIITDDVAVARAIAAHPGPLSALIEVDVGEHRGGVGPDDDALLAIAAALGPRLAGVITHAGHSYAGRSDADMAATAAIEHAGITRAATRLRDAGHQVGIVSLGSSPTALHARTLAGVTEVRAGVYMFGDLFQAQIGTHADADIALTVLTSVVGRRPGVLLLDAGAIALSKDRSTAAPGLRDDGFGLVWDLDGKPSLGRVVIERAYQEHGVAVGAPDLPIGTRLRVAPNHTCLTAAAHEGYAVVDGGREVIGTWARINGW